MKRKHEDVTKRKIGKEEVKEAEDFVEEVKVEDNFFEEAKEDLPLSGVKDRPFCKGRAYDPNRYSNTEE